MEQNGNSSPAKSTGIFKKIWRFFSSVKLALALILLLSGFSLLGTLIPSANAFHSWWFLTAGALLMLNIIVCTLNRWGSIKLSLHGGKIVQQENFYTTGVDHIQIELAAGSDNLSQITARVLKQHGYRVRSEEQNGTAFIAADKHRFFRLGTFASHLSLVLFVLAYLLGSYFGFKDGNFVVAAGNTEQINHNTGLSVQLVSFTDEYYPDGTPKDYLSEVVVYQNGLPVTQGPVRVNHPLSYKGISIHQMYFGPAVTLQITQNGKTLYQGAIALSSLVNNQGLQRYVGYLDLPGGYSLQIISSAVNVQDPVIPPGEIAVYVKQNGSQTGVDSLGKGISRDIGGLSFNYQGDTKFSGFLISRDPGNALVWIAAALFLLGIMAVFYFPYRQVWLFAQPQPDGSTRLFLRLGVSRGYNGAAELKALGADIQKQLSVNRGV